MSFGNYEISAKLVIDNKDAQRTLKQTIKELSELQKVNDKVLASEQKKAKYQDEVAKKVEGNAKRTSNAYNKEYTNIEKLTAGINNNRLAHNNLGSEIEKEHNKLKSQNATVQQATKFWKKFADERGLTYSKGRLSSALKDDALNINKIGQASSNAIKHFTNGYNELQTQLRNGSLTTSQFKSRVNDLSRIVSEKYNVSVKNAGQANYIFKNRVNDVNLALKEYGNMLKSTNRMMQRGTFSTEQSKMLRMTRDEVGRLVLGHQEYNKILEQGGRTARNAFTQVNDYLQKNYSSLGLSKEQVLSFNNAYKGWKSTFNSIGGTLDMVTTKTGNYNKLLTTTTRSQRMQNYAMQVSAMRYNAVGTMAGFVGGMLVQQLAMGFAEARIEAVRFEQQSQQMLKTSKLTTGEINKLTTAIKNYTKQNRKVNTQGLEYTVSQVTKLNNLSEKSAEKAIPVIADITNMMQLNGRTQEDAILAVNDALDGQFKRLQEIGVQGKNQLKDLGWTGELDSEKDVNSLLDALTKLGKRKGWSDLTKDVSTLDDAYRVLGNTIDDVLTPAMVSITPTIVSVIEGFSGFLNVFTDMPIAVQGVVSALGVLGVAWGKMELEMLKSKLYGTEFFARLTGLDDGMYGITQSIGAVKTAVADEAISFQEGIRTIQNYHNASAKSLMTFDEMSNKLNMIKEAQDALNAEREAGLLLSEKDVFDYQNKQAQLSAEQAELLIMRESSNAYATQQLALSNLNSERRLQISALQQMTGLSKNEAGLLLANTGMINKTTGEVKSLTNGTVAFNNAIEQVGLSSKNFETGVSGIAEGMKTAKGQSDKLKTSVLGLAKAENLNNTANRLGIATGELYNNIVTKKISATEIENKLIKEGVLTTEAKTLALSAENEALALNNVENLRNAGILSNITKGIKATIVSIYEEIKALTLRAAAWALANPAMAIAIGLASTLAVVIGGTLLSSQIALTDSLKEFNTVLNESESKISELNEQIEKAQGQTKTDLIERRNQLQKEYNEVNSRSTYLTQQSEIALGKLNKEREKYNRLIAEANKGTNGSNTQMKSDIDNALSEYDRITNYITRFGLTASGRNAELYKEQLGNLNGLKKGSQEYNDQMKHNTEQMSKYLQTQQDIIDAHGKMLSEDTFTRWGGYFDNWTAHMTMSLIESDAKINNWVSNNRANFLKFTDNIGKSLSDGWDNIWDNTTIDEMFGGLWNKIVGFPQWLSEKISSIELPNLGDLLFQTVSATDGSENSGGMTHEDWIRFIGFDPNTLGTDISTGIETSASQVYDYMYNFGYNIYTYLKTGVGNLVGIVTNKITDIINAIINASSKVAQNAFNFGKTIYDKFKQGVSNLSQIVNQEINEIVQALKNAPSKVAQSAQALGSSIVNGVNKIIDHHSPGRIARIIRDEVEYVKDFLSQGATTVAPIAKAFGSAIVNNTGNLSLTDSAGVINDNNAIMASTNEAQTYTSQQYGAMTNTVTDAFGIMSDTANTDMNNVAMKNATYLSQMNKDTQSNMTQIQTTTDGKLKTMQSTTVSATNNMTKAWASMRNNIVSSATQIRNQSYAKFSSLQRSIAGFYRQIQSATFSGGLPAGPGRMNSLSSRTIRKRQSSSVGYAGPGPAGASEDYIKLLNKKNRSEKDIEDFYLKYPEAIPKTANAVAGGINPSVHTNKQYSYAKNWSIKDPTMYGVLLNMGYKVDDFNGKSPSISSISDFERIVTQLFTAHPTHYEFYYNSRKSNAQAWASGGFNCFDGAELVMEIANDLGFGASMTHGSWNGIPHVSAVVGGRLFDTTQFQNRGVWRGASGVSFPGYAGSPDKGRRVKWSTAGRGKFAGGGNTTNNNRKNVVNVTVTGNTFIGEKEYKKQMENIAENIFYEKMSVNPCIGI